MNRKQFQPPAIGFDPRDRVPTQEQVKHHLFAKLERRLPAIRHVVQQPVNR